LVGNCIGEVIKGALIKFHGGGTCLSDYGFQSRTRMWEKVPRGVNSVVSGSVNYEENLIFDEEF